MLGMNDLADEQLRAIAFLQAGADSLLAADVGTGKTVMALTATCIDKRRWLVLAPLLVAKDTWAHEPGNWSHLEHLRDGGLRVAVGDSQERLRAIESDAQYVVMNYENLSWLCEEYPAHSRHNTLPFTGVIFDELDKLKDVSSTRFKDFRGRIKWFERRIGLTGTLTPNNLLELWGQVYMVDGGETFGRSFYKWRAQYFYPTDFHQYNWEPFPTTRAKLLEQLAPQSYRVKARGLPTVEFTPAHRMRMPATMAARYKTLSDEYFLAIQGGGKKTHIVDAANAAVLTGKLQQVCSGFVYVDGKKDAVWHSVEKFNWLRSLMERDGALGDRRTQVLIVYQFQEELRMLREIWPELSFLGGGTTPSRAQEYIRQWNAGEIKLLAIHPASASHGLNLQKSGAHDIVFLTIPWSGGLLKQVIGRLARRGQAAPCVRIWTALYKNSVDEQVYKSASKRLDDMEGFLDDLEKITGTRSGS